MKSLLLAACLTLVASTGFASELDNDAAYVNQNDLQGTVVVRVSAKNNSVAYLKTSQVPASESAAKALAKNPNFKDLPNSKIRNELDMDAGASSWYWYPGYSYGYNYSYSYSNLYWYGNVYNPCYNYYYGGYNYYYYSAYSYRWW